MTVEIEILSGSQQGRRLRFDGDRILVGDVAVADVRFDPDREAAVRGKNAVLTRDDAEGWQISNLGVGVWWIGQTPIESSQTHCLQPEDLVRASESGPDFCFRPVASPPECAIPASALPMDSASPTDVAEEPPPVPREFTLPADYAASESIAPRDETTTERREFVPPASYGTSDRRGSDEAADRPREFAPPSSYGVPVESGGLLQRIGEAITHVFHPSASGRVALATRPFDSSDRLAPVPAGEPALPPPAIGPAESAAEPAISDQPVEPGGELDTVQATDVSTSAQTDRTAGLSPIDRDAFPWRGERSESTAFTPPASKARRKRRQTSPVGRLIGILVSGVLGLACAYAIACYVNAANDVLHVFSKRVDGQNLKPPDARSRTPSPNPGAKAHAKTPGSRS